MIKFYDPIAERWHEMVSAPIIDRYKPPTVSQGLTERTKQNLRVAEHKHVWDAIEATATATQMNGIDQERSDE